MKQILKQLLVIGCISSFLYPTVGFAQNLSNFDEHKGLYTNPEPDRIPNGGHPKFQNVYIKDTNINVVKGRDRLTSTALSDKTVNGLFYYETPSVIGESISSELLLHCDGTDASTTITDSSVAAHIMTAQGDAQIDTAESKFGGASCLFDGTGDYIESDGSTDWNISDTDFTISFWVRFNGDPGTARVDFINRSAPTSTWEFYLSSNQLAFTVANGAIGTASVSEVWNPATAIWYHVELVRKSNTHYMFIDGTQLGTEDILTTTDIDTSADKLNIGIHLNGAQFPLNGWIDDLRFDLGTAYHTANFTAPTQAYIITSDTAVQKFILVDQDEIVTYDVDWTNRTTIASGLTDDKWSFTQVSTALYATSKANGQYKWTGTGSAVDQSDTAATPPPDHAYIEEYKGVLFSCDGRNLRWSDAVGENEADDEVWATTNHILIGNNNHTCTGLVKSRNSLIVFTAASIQELTGFADTFELRNLTTNIGAVSNNSISVDTNGDIIFNAGIPGVYKLQVGGQLTDTSAGVEIDRTDTTITKISSQLDDVFEIKDDDIVIAISEYNGSHSYYDLENNLYFLYIGDDCLLYDNVNKAWTHIPASTMNASTYLYSTIDGTDNDGYLVDNSGFVYRNWLGYENGIESGTVTGTPTSSTSTTLVDSGATFNTTNDGLAGLWVFVDNENGEWRQIQSNTATQLTISPAWTTNPVVSDDYYIGYIIADWATKQYNFDTPPRRSKTNHLWLVHNKSETSQPVEVNGFEDKSTFTNRLAIIDLVTNFVDKVSFSLRAYWVQWKLRSFIYNTSDTIDAPIDISAYVIDYDIEQER